ncbi:MAG TPA: DoxX family protein [Rheinheimera sp.]|uniref:DoxX family protein n=1 Tax=Rheinheimera sp. TaxID=1869214 RepID=UPI000ED71DE9|nr:DoxX family protein [Rheinheimera sp.]HCU65174.1 DoxX family protein [Rheinheimera sp.]
MFTDIVGRTEKRLWLVLRLTLALLMAIHGWTRWLNGGVLPFGDWLTSQGLPAGFYLAAFVTAYEIIATLLYAAGKWLWQLSVGFVLIYATGLVLVHAPFGWFVVGAGRNGVEYSVLLLVLLCCVGYRDYVRAKDRHHEFN